ncbi:MAG: DUF5057 domain-containing protein [Eubacterium sp.]|nr:DUF5057 domain-containing protein [Eubacterium sp.]
MIITNANVRAASAGSYEKNVSHSTKLVDLNGNSVGTLGISFASNTKRDYLEVSEDNAKNGANSGSAYEKGRKDDSVSAQKNEKLNPSGNNETLKIATPIELKGELIMQMLSALTGGRFRASSIILALSANLRGSDSDFSLQNAAGRFSSIRSGGSGSGGLSIVREEAMYESENVSYSANGRVNTADGKTIDFSVNMNMSRSTETFLRQTVGFMPQVQTGKKVDPLVINYGGNAASLTDEKFEFDLDVDGKLDNISFAGMGSGFLALDKNNDGKVNDGNELFGPQNGDGFAELRKYDSDSNGWIDEADDVYSKLKIWSRDKDGNEILFSLKELDVGAIYLDESKTEFEMYDERGNAQGNMRSTSFFLKDSGGGGTISHFDLLA